MSQLRGGGQVEHTRQEPTSGEILPTFALLTTHSFFQPGLFPHWGATVKLQRMGWLVADVVKVGNRERSHTRRKEALQADTDWVVLQGL